MMAQKNCIISKWIIINNRMRKRYNSKIIKLNSKTIIKQKKGKLEP